MPRWLSFIAAIHPIGSIPAKSAIPQTAEIPPPKSMKHMHSRIDFSLTVCLIIRYAAA